MKVRLGITSPLQLESATRGFLAFPSFTERNFALGSEVEHAVWVDSTHALQAGVEGLHYENASSFTARGALSEFTLTDPASVLVVERPSEVSRFSCEHRFEHPPGRIVEEIAEVVVRAPKRVLLVIDGSISMEGRAEDIASALESMPEGIELGVIFAGDRVREALVVTETGEDAPMRAAQLLRNFEYAGGADLIPALTLAWDRCAAVEDSLVLLLHGSQPVELSSLDALMQRLDRRSDGTRVLALRATRGPNRVVRTLAEKSSVSLLPRTGALQRDLEKLFEAWSGAPQVRAVRREAAEADSSPLPGTGQATLHVARLWANERIREEQHSKVPGWREEAIELAAYYQLVTPVSGAVVLESARQFEEAGLTPGDPNRVPIVPEPELFVLILMSLGVVWMSWRKKRVLV